MNARWPVALLLLAGLSACADRPRNPIWSRLAVEDLDTGQQVQHGRAMAAKNELFSGLLEALTSSVQARGHADSLAVCKLEAPRLARQVGARQGLSIGRSSHRLRNPANRAPAWAQASIDAAVAEPRVVASSAGDLGVLLPILTAEACLACHGAPDRLAPGVAEALAREYPDDRATGFAEGELRGWFWIEVPPVGG